MEIGHINRRIRELIVDNTDEAVQIVLREELIAHLSTPEGREELAGSPHRGLKASEAADLLMQGVPSRIRRERAALEGK